MSKFLSPRLAAMDAYVPGEQPQVRDLIKLNTNESPFPPAPGVREAAAEAAGTLQLYSDLPASALIGKLAETYGLAPEQIAVSNGSDEVLAFAFQAFGQDGAAFPDITYGFYTVWADLYGMEKTIFPLDEDFRIRPSDYDNCGKLAIIANPNAPTGVSLPLADIENILKGNRDHVVIVDEAYVDFGGESALALLPKYENLLVVRTYSKSRQMAGARLGFAMGSAALIEDLNRVRYSFHPYNVNAMTQAAGLAALQQPDYFEACRIAVMETREWVRGEMEALGFDVLPSQANFLFAKPNGMTGKKYQQALRERNILVRRFDLPRIQDYLRITVGTREQMETLIAVTKELIQ